MRRTESFVQSANVPSYGVTRELLMRARNITRLATSPLSKATGLIHQTYPVLISKFVLDVSMNSLDILTKSLLAERNGIVTVIIVSKN